MTIVRYLHSSISGLCFVRHKMAFLSGPRQCGKTTLAKSFLPARNGRYYNWDDVVFRRLWTKSPGELLAIQKHKEKPLILFDEIHKAKGWKSTLKGLYDTLPYPVDILVTGSARLNVYKKGGDSLLGRYIHLRLHPFSVGELLAKTTPDPDDFIKNLFLNTAKFRKSSQDLVTQLFHYGGFPEPFLSQSQKIATIWKRSRVEKIIREDLRDLSRIPELSRVEMLTSLLPERAGQLLSYQSLREDLEVSHDTITHWMGYLNELYYCYELKPWSKSISRSYKKEGKLYLWDWSEVSIEGQRFENMVANHLLKACHYWTDTGHGDFRLFYLRNKEKQEIDFLIVRDKKPWLPVECKLSDETPAKSFYTFLPQIGVNYFLQIVKTPRVSRQIQIGKTKGLIASASQVFRYLP